MNAGQLVVMAKYNGLRRLLPGPVDVAALDLTI